MFYPVFFAGGKHPFPEFLDIFKAKSAGEAEFYRQGVWLVQFGIEFAKGAEDSFVTQVFEWGVYQIVVYPLQEN